MESFVSLVAGGLIGFLASIAKDFFLEKTKKRYKEIELKRERAEELYILLEGWANWFFSQKNHLTLVMEEHISFNEYLDYVIREGEKNTVNYKRIEMIINIYFQNLFPSYEKIINQINIANDVEFKYKTEYEKGNTDGKIYIKKLLLP